MAWIRSLFWLKEYFSFSLFVEHIPGSINTLADSILRLERCASLASVPSMALQVLYITGPQTSHVNIISCTP